MKENKTFEIEQRNSILIISFSHSGNKPPILKMKTIKNLSAFLLSIWPINDIKAVIFRSTHKNVFIAGASYNELKRLTPYGAFGFSRIGQNLMNLIEDSPFLTISAIGGTCMGGGLDLALACDLRIIKKDVSIAHPGIKRGFFTGWGGTHRLVKKLGDKGKKALLSGNDIEPALLADCLVSSYEKATEAAIEIAESAITGEYGNILKYNNNPNSLIPERKRIFLQPSLISSSVS